MIVHNSCMALPKTRKPAKKQRGISLPPELYKCIQDDADRLGLTWNDVAERVLVRAFLLATRGNNEAESRNIRAALILKEVPDDDD